MDNNKSKGLIAAVAILAVIAVTGIVYAGYTQTLNINGTATVNKAKWKIKFDNLSTVALTGTAKEVTTPTINDDTSIGDYAVTLTTPGDSISYTFDVVNDGTFDAEISSVNIPTPVCTGSGDNETNDANNVCGNVTYSLTYADGSQLTVGDTLAAGATKNLKLTLTYSSATPAEQLPTNDVAISGLATSIVYSQS